MSWRVDLFPAWPVWEDGGVSPAEIVRRLKSSHLFSGLPDDVLRSFAAETMPRSYKEGAYLWHAGDEASHFTIIQTGLVEVRRSTPSGESTLMGLFGPRESVGDFAVMDIGKYPADAIAISETLDVLRVRASPVMEIMRNQPRVANAVSRSLVEHVKVLRAKIDVMTAGPVEKRLAVLMQHLIERFGDEGEDRQIHVPVALSRVQLARVVGARAETVIRTMSRWQKEGWLVTTPEGFHLMSADALDRILNED
jgi:CRP-like cAMP-binding protein